LQKNKESSNVSVQTFFASVNIKRREVHNMWTWEVENAKGVMVIIHGAGEHHGRYEWLRERWNEEGFHVIMGDLPGQGVTTRRRGHIRSFKEYIEAIEGWIEEAQTYDLPIFLLGHSMGALTAIRALQIRSLPVWGVILSSPALGLKEQPPAFKDVLSKGLNKLMPGKLVQSPLVIENVTRNQRLWREHKEDKLYVKKVSVRWYRQFVEAMNLAFKDMDKFPDVPLLILQAGEDKVIEKFIVRQWFDDLSLSEKIYKEWTGLYHEVFNEPEQDQVFAYAKSFVHLHV
jgi:lysophospholipase